MLYRLNLLPLLIIPILTGAFVIRERLIDIPGFRPDRTAATLPPAEFFEITSAHTGATYQIYVQVPHDYDPNGEGYPVFYTVQASPTAGIYDELIAPLVQRRHIPDVIFVSIIRRESSGGFMGRLRAAAAGSRPAHTWSDDLTFYPDPEDPNVGGGAEKFVAFLQEELIRKINRQYRTAPGDMGIGGRDLGGAFAVEICYRRPGMFERAVAIAPRVHHADYAMIDGLRSLEPPRRRRSRTRLYVGVGQDNYPIIVHGFELLRRTLEQMETRSVTVEFDLMRGRSGANEVIPAAQAGLRFVYDE